MPGNILIQEEKQTIISVYYRLQFLHIDLQ